MDQVLPGLIHAAAEFLRHDERRVLPGSLLGAVAENHLRRGIPAADPEIHVPLDGRHRRLFEVQLQLLGGHPQRFLGLLALGDVGVGDDGAADVPGRANHFHREPARASGRVAGILQPETRLLAGQHSCHSGDRGLRVWIADVAGRDANFEVIRADADFLFVRIAVLAGEAQPRLVDRKDFPRLVQHHDVRGKGVEDAPLELRALAQRYLGLFDFGDVEGGAHQAGDGPVSVAQRHFVNQQNPRLAAGDLLPDFLIHDRDAFQNPFLLEAQALGDFRRIEIRVGLADQFLRRGRAHVGRAGAVG